MKTSARRRFGVATLIISPLVGLVLFLSGVPLLTFTGSHTSSFAGGRITSFCYKLHWPLLAVCAAGLVGLACVVWPKRTPRTLPP
jgi:hypothetical protein